MFRNEDRLAGRQGGAAGSGGERPLTPQTRTGSETGEQDPGGEVPRVFGAHTAGAETGELSPKRGNRPLSRAFSKMRRFSKWIKSEEFSEDIEIFQAEGLRQTLSQ